MAMLKTFGGCFKDTKLGRRITKARIITRNRNELGTTTSSLPWLNLHNSAKGDPEGVIRDVYEEYVTSISAADKAISLELAYLLWFILHTIKPRLIVDLGSGFSSFLFRYYQNQHIDTGAECRVFSCDDNEDWLERTAGFLQNKNLSLAGLLPWDRFLAEQGHEHPDLVLHDLGSIQLRIKALPQVLNLCTSRTMTIVDDIHKPPVRQAVLSEIDRRGLRGYDLTRFTYDRFGRYAWMLTAQL